MERWWKGGGGQLPQEFHHFFTISARFLSHFAPDFLCVFPQISPSSLYPEASKQEAKAYAEIALSLGIEATEGRWKWMEMLEMVVGLYCNQHISSYCLRPYVGGLLWLQVYGSVGRKSLLGRVLLFAENLEKGMGPTVISSRKRV